MRWRARTIVQRHAARRASRPQLTRDPLGAKQSMLKSVILVPRLATLSGLILAACQPVVPSAADEPPWLGIATSSQVKAFLDSAAVSNRNPIVHSVLRFRYTEPRRLGEDTPPFQESRTTVEIDCGGRRGRTLDLHLLAADGSELADLPLQPDVAAWKPFDQHSLSTYFLAACIRMGRIRGRLEPS